MASYCCLMLPVYITSFSISHICCGQGDINSMSNGHCCSVILTTPILCEVWTNCYNSRLVEWLAVYRFRVNSTDGWRKTEICVCHVITHLCVKSHIIMYMSDKCKSQQQKLVMAKCATVFDARQTSGSIVVVNIKYSSQGSRWVEKLKRHVNVVIQLTGKKREK